MLPQHVTAQSFPIFLFLVWQIALISHFHYTHYLLVTFLSKTFWPRKNEIGPIAVKLHFHFNLQVQDSNKNTTAALQLVQWSLFMWVKVSWIHSSLFTVWAYLSCSIVIKYWYHILVHISISLKCNFFFSTVHLIKGTLPKIILIPSTSTASHHKSVPTWLKANSIA